MPTTKQERNTRYIVRTIALFLGLGGAFGCGLALWLLGKYMLASVPMITSILIMLFLSMFAACAWAGWGLWKEKPGALKWAKILLAFQIPVLAVPGFIYKFYTGVLLSTSWSFNESKLLFNLYFGSSFDIKIFSHPDDVREGLNLAALIALILLARLPKRPDSGQIPTISALDSTPLNPQGLPPNP